MAELIQHHIKYKEIHGVDEIVLMERGEHRALHNRLRREGKCSIPADELRRISNIAEKRTPKYKKSQEKHREKKIKKSMQYIKNNIRSIVFSIDLGNHARLKEYFEYNIKTGNFYMHSCFGVSTGFKLYYLKEFEVM